MAERDPRTRKLSKAMEYAKRYGLTAEDRHALASTLLWRDITSWSTLTEDQLGRLLDALEGFALISHLMRDQPPHTSTTA